MKKLKYLVTVSIKEYAASDLNSSKMKDAVHLIDE